MSSQRKEAKHELPKFYSTNDEEYATELADRSMPQIQEHSDNQIYAPVKEVVKGRSWGLTAVVLSAAAWFIWPSLLAPAAVIAGLVAFIQGRRGLGSIAIVAGLLAFFAKMGYAIV